ncbi:NUDIX hydrolase [Candidatus Saccharibacteria bacterium]|nr:MAG: NUDIX hydrolase [Candidatus Saccharibacteria bacterium]
MFHKSNTVQHDSETLAEGQQVFTACAFITHEIDGVTKVFLAKRADSKKFLPGVWELPGGHIDYGEDLKIAVAREVMEEFGMCVRIGDLLDVFTYINEVKKAHAIEIIYFAQFADPLENIRPKPEDHSAYGWFALEELSMTYAGSKDETDPEMVAIRKGFAQLKAEM